MFSQQMRCHYAKAPVAEVICQLRFPEILTIEANIPADFQEQIRGDFPRYSVTKETPAPKPVGTPGHITLQPQPQTNNYQFMSADGVWRVNLTSKFISLACTRYNCWEEFGGMLDKPLAAFIRLYKPAYFERVGLRYINFISRRDLELENVPYRELLHPCWLGPMGEEDVQEAAASRCSVDTEMALRGGCRVKIHAGPGLVKRNGKPDPEVKFVFDQDLFMQGNVPVNHSAGALETLHSQSFSIFRGAVTELLHDAMEPEIR